MDWVLYGIKPVVVALVADALWQLGRRLRSAWLDRRSAGACLGCTSPVSTSSCAVRRCVVVDAGCSARARSRCVAIVPIAPLGAVAAVVPSLGADVRRVPEDRRASCSGAGTCCYAFLRGDLVDQLHWLTEAQLLDAIAVGQVTPGPLFTTATFMGYVVRGVPGALVATVAIFLRRSSLSAWCSGSSTDPPSPAARRSSTARAQALSDSWPA